MEADTIVDTLFGSHTEFKHCVGYCRKKGKYMTVKIMKQKECLRKQCKFLDKKEHDYWQMRENIKANKKLKKNREYYQSGKYASDCEKGKIACWIPFLLNVGTLIIGLCSPYTFFYVIIFSILLLPVSLTITLICISKQAKYCENLAEEHKVPSYDPTYQKAIATGKAARLGLIASAVGTYHSISREMKSISNLEH